jgi:hypothetical protein
MRTRNLSAWLITGAENKAKPKGQCGATPSHLPLFLFKIGMNGNVKAAIKKIISYFDARDAFCLFGFLLLFVGVAHFNWAIALIVTGAIILIKGLTKWV